jgi:uncharacterized membrane protein SpoIIM required for sporulation
MILDLTRFVTEERPYWTELDTLLRDLEKRSGELSVVEARRLHYLHQRAASDLARLSTFSGEERLLAELEALVARAHAEVHASAGRMRLSFRPWHWFSVVFPGTFRRHHRLFLASLGLFLLGGLLGAGALAFDPDSKPVIMPFPHLMKTPTERVMEEEKNAESSSGAEATFSAYLMTHNTRVSIATMGLGSTYGIGTGILLFYNGVILGAVGCDYVMDGQTVFLLAWLLPHGSIEIPAILIAGQAGFLLAATLIGGAGRLTLRERFRRNGPDLATLIGGVATLLVWAGVVEAFLSQLHEPTVPYWAKIAFGSVSLGLLAWLLGVSGSKHAEAKA